MHTIIGLVAQGLGVGLVPNPVGTEQRTGIAWRPVTPPVPLTLAAAWLPHASLPRLTQFLACSFSPVADLA